MTAHDEIRWLPNRLTPIWDDRVVGDVWVSARRAAAQINDTTRTERVSVTNGGLCPNDTSIYELAGGGAICVPAPRNGSCPDDFELDQSLCI